MKLGSIELARSLCYEIAGPTDEDDDTSGSGYGSVDIAEILSAEVEKLRAAMVTTLDENMHLADGDNCTLIALKNALRESGTPWGGDDLNNAELIIPVMNCPFCGRSPSSTGRMTTEGEEWKDEQFVHFIACYCGGYSATAHKAGSGRTARCAERDAVAKWNKRYTPKEDKNA